jgi:hypothetical protein
MDGRRAVVGGQAIGLVGGGARQAPGATPPPPAVVDLSADPGTPAADLERCGIRWQRTARA